MSGRTGASRAPDANNAYLYSQGDQGRMQRINDALQKYNPSLAGSQMLANDRFDVEASVISAGKKMPRGLDGGVDETRSVMSRDSNISTVSRKSTVSMIDMDSIASIAAQAKKMPGERGLRANADRRMQKAQMSLIDAQLRKLQHTEDLSYSSRAAHPNESSDIQELTTSRTDEKGRQLVDEVTLARLIDECKEEQEQQQMIEMAQSEHNQSNQDVDSLLEGS